MLPGSVHLEICIILLMTCLFIGSLISLFDLQHFLSQNQIVMAIKAPYASYIEVPDPVYVGSTDTCGFLRICVTFNYVHVGFLNDQDPYRIDDRESYKMIVRSHTGPIDLYLLRYIFAVLE